MTTITELPYADEQIRLFSLGNDVLRLTVTNLGCRILSLYAPDKNGATADVILGLDSLSDVKNDWALFGGVLGRVANRIENASFSIGKNKYNLPQNNGKNSIHGGLEGFDKKIFEVSKLSDGLSFAYASKDGEEGYPGDLILTVDYRLIGDTLEITYTATTSKDTICSFTNHMYFNLAATENVLDHCITVNADQVGYVDNTCLATGEIVDVADTVFDFREETRLGTHMDSNHEQLRNARGYDHPYLLRHGDLNVRYTMKPGEKPEVNFPLGNDDFDVKLKDPASGRVLLINTTAPAVHVYTGNYLNDAPKGKTGAKYPNYAGIALETECLPNAINTDYKDQVILKKGEVFTSRSTYRFTT